MIPLVLIGDSDRQRFENVDALIRRSFQLDVVHARTFRDLLVFLGTHSSAVQLVLLADGLPYTVGDDSRSFKEYCATLFDVQLTVGSRAVIGYLYDGKPTPVTGRMQPDLFAPYPSDDHRRALFLGCLSGRFLARRLPELTIDNDALLRDQIRALGRGETFEDGAELLRHIIGGFFLDPVAVYRLTSGLSGAYVFRLIPSDGEPGQYIVKLDSTQWKLLAEAKNHPEVIGGIPNLREYKPRLVKPLPTAPANGSVVSSGGWCGLCYVYAGGDPFGRTIDLQRALVGAPDDLQGLTARTPFAFDVSESDAGSVFRHRMLSLTLDWLTQEWSMSKTHANRAGGYEAPWSSHDAPARAYAMLPPYRLSAKLKGRILAFLEGADSAIGRRLLSHWRDAAELVGRFVTWSADKYGAPGLDGPISMVKSPAHGDLNANNVLFCIEKQDPIFFIDFPMYQTSGHALQDFARLETEIKYALMDRQECSPTPELAALDLTASQLPLWLELEEHLQGESWADERTWLSAGFVANVALSLSLVQRVRKAAQDVQGQTFGVASVPTFVDEYRVPLLYHTLRAITYTSLSLFKRVLAVDAAARMLIASGFS